MSGRTSSWVGDQLAISEACPAVKQCLGDRQIAIGHAALLAKVDDAAVQEEMLGLLLKHGWSIGQLEEQLRGGPGPSSEPDASAGPRARKSSGSRGPVVCGYCQVEHGPADVQMVAVCSGCASKIGPAPVGEVLVPAGLLREAVSVLAGTQAGAGPAEAFESLLELVESAEGGDGMTTIGIATSPDGEIIQVPGIVVGRGLAVILFPKPDEEGYRAYGVTHLASGYSIGFNAFFSKALAVGCARELVRICSFEHPTVAEAEASTLQRWGGPLKAIFDRYRHLDDMWLARRRQEENPWP